MTKQRHQRKLRNLKVTEKYRFQYLGLWIMVCFFFIALLNISIFLLYEQMRLLAAPEGVDVELGLALDNTAATITILALTLAFGFAVVALAVFTAHRIGGPFIALKRTMAQIRDGDLNQRLKFRNYDKLEDLEAAFNEMMDSIQARVENERAGPFLRVAGE